ncbi:hypothetical protein DES44_2277 [Roseateles depolymerans]|uniref:Uncharacterized protein n=1 Tax=Roseateles depolymerans TaxID=76731 RepID=A0A0U3MEP0_9BURK|nr:hypothetical protein RD2015_2322 [Roseateles depolymerans]REG19771.1 hypothetical protein DES44_2277 [Roseateles depolymerans]
MLVRTPKMLLFATSNNRSRSSRARIALGAATSAKAIRRHAASTAVAKTSMPPTARLNATGDSAYV